MVNAQELLAGGESQLVEFKKSTSLLPEAIETVCAFANQHGGYLIFGIDDEGKVLGQQVADDTLKNIAIDRPCFFTFMGCLKTGVGAH